MKVTVTATYFLLWTFSTANAETMYAKFGGCLDRQKHNDGVGAGEAPAFHCHFDSTVCADGEEWIVPSKVADEGLDECTCDDDYHNNVYRHTCYDLAGGHAVTCSSDIEGCLGDNPLGFRYNSHHDVPEDCGHGSSAYGAFSPESCGKRCTCNFDYTATGELVTLASTPYGACTDQISRESVCAVQKEDCDAGWDWTGPHDDANWPMDDKCYCDDVRTGSCVDSNTGVGVCVVAADSCDAGQMFFSAKATADVGYDCRLCANSLSTEEPVVTPAPSSAEPAPTSSPTPERCYNDASWRLKKHKDKDCVWVNKPKRKDRECEKKSVKKRCPGVCGICCDDDPDYTFQDKNNKERDCDWLSTKKAGAKKKYCKKDPTKMTKVYCPKACGTCFFD